MFLLKIDELAIKPCDSPQVVPGTCLYSLTMLVVEVSFLQTPHGVFLCAGSGPSGQFYDNNMLPELPSVPDTLPNSSLGGHPGASDDIDFDDLSRRFEELKKKT